MAGQSPRFALTGRLSALNSRDYRLYWAGQSISLIGTQMQHVAIAWQLYLLTHSPLALGMLGLFRVAPVLLFALGSGVVADAVDRRRLMMVTQTVMALCSLVLLWATWSQAISAPLIYGVAVCAGAAAAFDNPARGALIPRLVPREHLANALSLNVMSWQLAAVLGPAVAGFVMAYFGVLPVYVIDVVSYTAVVASLAMMRSSGAAPEGGAVTFEAALDGLRFIRGNPLILSTMILDFLAMFLGGALLLMPIFADQILGVGAKGLGLLYSAQPTGAALAAFYLSVGPKIKKQGIVFLAMIFVYGAAITVFGLSHTLLLSLAALAVSGAADTVSTVIRGTLRQLLTPDEMRGRMTSVGMIFFIGGPQLGEVEAGVVAKAFGVVASVVSGGIGCMILPFLAAWLLPSVRRFEAD